MQTGTVFPRKQPYREDQITLWSSFHLYMYRLIQCTKNNSLNSVSEWLFIKLIKAKWKYDEAMVGIVFNKLLYFISLNFAHWLFFTIQLLDKLAVVPKSNILLLIDIFLSNKKCRYPAVAIINLYDWMACLHMQSSK